MIYTKVDIGKKKCAQMQEVDGQMRCVSVEVEFTDAEKDEILLEWNAQSLDSVRNGVIKAIKELRDTRMGAVSAGWNIEAYKIYKLMENRFVPGTENATQSRVAAIFEYAKTKLQWAKTATLEELQVYDPNTDVGWPS